MTKLVENSSQWISCADQALYQAKDEGRNQCVIYQHIQRDKYLCQSSLLLITAMKKPIENGLFL